MRGLTNILSMVLLIVLVSCLWGCGGGSGKNALTAGRKGGKGKLTMSFKWPTPAKAASRHRFIPLASMSVVVSVSGPNGFTATSPPLTPTGSGAGATSTYTFTTVPTGTVAVTSVAFPNPDGTGTAQAQAINPSVAIQADQTASLTLTMDTTIDNGRTTISGPGQLTRTRADNFTVTFQDGNGNTVLVAPSTITWDTDDHTIALVNSVDPATHLTANISGITARSTNVHATYQEPGEAAQFPGNPNRVGSFSLQILPIIYICDRNNNNIVEIDNMNGDNRAVLPPTGASYTFNQPQGVTVDSVGGVYVADTGNNRVARLKTDGTNLATLTIANGTNLVNPTAVVVDTNDNLYILDNGNNRIVVCTYDPQGNAINVTNTIAISSTTAHNGISAPNSSVVVYSEDPISGVGTPAVTQYDGSTFSTFTGQGVVALKFPWGIISNDNDLFIVDRDANQVLQLDGQNNGGGVLNFDTITVQARLDNSGGIPLNAPRGLAFDGNNNLYIADTGNSRIIQTNSFFRLGLFANTSAYATSLAAPYAVAVDQPIPPRF